MAHQPLKMAKNVTSTMPYFYCHYTDMFQDAETRARVDQRLYFDMGVFYKVN